MNKNNIEQIYFQQISAINDIEIKNNYYLFKNRLNGLKSLIVESIDFCNCLMLQLKKKNQIQFLKLSFFFLISLCEQLMELIFKNNFGFYLFF